MRFPDIDEEEIDPILVKLVQVLGGFCRANERRAGATAKDQHRGFSSQVREFDGLLPIHILKGEVGRGVSVLERALGDVWPAAGRSCFSRWLSRKGEGCDGDKD